MSGWTYVERAEDALRGTGDDATRAQALATLELANQVRIQNAIALADQHPYLETASGVQGLDALVVKAEGADGIRGDKLRPEIASALGIGG